MSKLVKDILTGYDNNTYDSARVLCVLSLIIYFGLSISSYLVHMIFEPIGFASGIATIVVGFGVHIYFKQDTEPK